MAMRADSHRRIFVAGTGITAALAVLTAYCQLLSRAAVPMSVSVSWALITVTSWSLFGITLWVSRAQLAKRVRRSEFKDLAAVIGGVFAWATTIALVWVLASTVLGGHDPYLSSTAKKLVGLTPFLLMVAVATTAALAAGHWRWELSHRPQSAQRASITASAAPAWIEFPEAPLLRLRREEVAVIRTASNYCKIHVGDRIVLVRITAKQLEERLAPLGFARIHRSTIVNLARVSFVRPDRWGRLSLLLDDGSRLDVSRGYRTALQRRLSS